MEAPRPHVEPPETATGVLKKLSPFWFSVREAMTLRVAVALLAAILGTSITAIVQFSHLRSDVSDLKDSIKGAQERAAADAALHQHVEDLDDRVSKLEELRDYQKKVLEEPSQRRRVTK